MEQELSQIMKNVGFLALENNGIELYMLETAYYFLIVEPTIKNKQVTYEFIKYSYNKNKGETRIIKCYFEGFDRNAMLKRVGSYIAFMLERGYLKVNNQKMLPFAKELSKRSIFM